MTDPTLPSQPEQEKPIGVEGTVQPSAETEKPATQEKIRGRLVPNRHDRRRQAAIARRERRKKRK